MSIAVFVLLLLTGIGTGLVGYLTGLASLVSYPVLLAVGLPPVAANVTNTLGLVGAGVGSTARGARHFLTTDRRATLWQSAIAAIGGLVGAGLLLVGGESSFKSIVPWLVLLASVLLLLEPKITGLRGEHSTPVWLYTTLLFCVCIYGGYFGAGSGVIYLAVTALFSRMAFEKAVFIKSMLLALSNLTASLLFAFFGPVDWWAALALGIGCIIGGNFGPPIQRHIPELAMRWTIALAGLVLAIWLWRS
ncbi:sulfite exporter TauE/SafE family protein [Propionibacterium sp.]|uniref:sulfite exporter TauE/SafE family protein n=1 Tax=Propionibacterium sp. TaxID=1977903 RepID=UPI0039E9D5AF